MLQLDLNVQRSEKDRMPKLYPSDSINSITVRIYFQDKDSAVIMQMLKDHKIMPAIWNPVPVVAALPAL